MQFKIIHRILACNEYLCTTKIRNNSLCNNCPSVDSIEHFLYSCPQTYIFWEKIANLCNQIENRDIDLDYKTVLLGPKPNLLLLCGLVTHGKWYVYKSKISSSPIIFDNFLVP